MNRRKFIQNIAFGTAGIGLTSTPLSLLANDDFVTITILHTNDLHSHIEPFTGTNERYANKGGLARISGLAKQARRDNPNTLLLDAGDMFQGTPYFNYFQGDLIFEVMSAAGYDAGTIGNHEFDNGLDGLLKPLPHAKFPIINSNYDFSNTVLAGKFPRWKIFERSGIKIGIYGLGIQPKGLIADKSFGDTLYNDPIQTALEMETLLKHDKKCDLIICLSHLGLRYKKDIPSDMVIAESTAQTDLIIGGHTHTFLQEPIFKRNSLGKEIIINQAWWGGLVMGKIDFVFERTRKRRKRTFTKNI